jgi:hypothetical protein
VWELDEREEVSFRVEGVAVAVWVWELEKMGVVAHPAAEGVVDFGKNCHLVVVLESQLVLKGVNE